MFELLTGKMELISTFSLEVYARTVDLLNSERIWFHIKTTDTGSRSRSARTIVPLGGRPEFEIQYQIFVKKQDYGRAVYLISKK